MRPSQVTTPGQPSARLTPLIAPAQGSAIAVGSGCLWPLPLRCSQQWLRLWRLFPELLIPLLLLLSVVTFAIIQAPPGDYGDYIRSMLINQGGVPAEQAEIQAEAYREANGLNDPIVFQYFRRMSMASSVSLGEVCMMLMTAGLVVDSTRATSSSN